MTIQNRSETLTKDLLALPLVDLVEMPLLTFGPLLRIKELPDDEVLGVLDHVLRLRLVRTLSRENDPAALRSELDDLRRLVPHARRAELDVRCFPWAARWASFGDIVEAALESLESRDSETVRQLAHCSEVLEHLERFAGVSQVNLGEAIGIKPANLSRILGILESNGLIKREAIGREKKVFLSRKAAPPRVSQFGYIPEVPTAGNPIPTELNWLAYGSQAAATEAEQRSQTIN
jgi:DNA-binding transcriptional ArsR family regulator